MRIHFKPLLLFKQALPSLEEFQEAWEASFGEWAFFPSRNAYGRISTATKADRIESAKHQFQARSRQKDVFFVSFPVGLLLFTFLCFVLFCGCESFVTHPIINNASPEECVRWEYGRVTLCRNYTTVDNWSRLMSAFCFVENPCTCEASF